MFVNAKSSKVCQHIVEQDRQAVFDGRLKPSDKLPSEKELIEDFLEFHRIIANVTGNPILAFLLDVVKNLPVRGLDSARQSTNRMAQDILKAHVRICEALAERNPEKAVEPSTAHILELGQKIERREKKLTVRPEA
jgi:DNA-binding FadR family transcriptional regulator